jgi:acyl-CoA synthetase (AMP-forming)/AMP-acid ligase II
MDESVQRSKQLVLGEALARWARRTPDAEAIVFRDRRLTWAEFDERVNRLANGLTGLGVGKGDRIGFVYPNCTEYLETALAAAKIGAIGVPGNFRFVAREHAYQLGHSGARVLLYADQFSDVMAEASRDLPGVEHRVCAGSYGVRDALDYEELIGSGSPQAPDVTVDDDDPASIMYTSGTTGPPKGAVLTHKNMAMCAMTYLAHFDWDQDTRVLVVLPLFHMAAYGGYMINLYCGAAAVITDQPEPEAIMAAVQQERITALTLVPAIWNWIVHHPEFDRYDLSSLEHCTTGAAVTPMDLKDRIVECFPGARIDEAFGMTETSATGTVAQHEDMFAKHGSVGRPVMYMDLRVVDENDRDVPVGEVGEVVYRGPGVLKEYYRDPEATADAFRNGWFHSGDLVRQDEDGYIFIVDRKKDIIISGGENISSAEVEDVLFSHPKVLEAAVIGVPDERWGEGVKAYVVLQPGETLTAEEVIEHCRERLAGFKKPRHVEFVTELPRTATGKVKKYELRERSGSQIVSNG